jgi:hypothetical protein
MTLPSSYTVTAVRNESEPWGYPYIQQDNDTTFTALLTSSGGYEGWLHSLAIHAGELTQLQKYHDEYQHLYWVERCWVWGIYHRLMTEGFCKLLHLYEQSGAPRDWSDNQTSAILSGVTFDSSITFDAAASRIEYKHNTSQQCEELTIAVEGDFSGSVAAGTLVDKGANYKFRTNGNQLDFNGSTIAHTFASNRQIAVTCKPGLKPRFFVDGEYIGEGSTVETPDDTDTTNLTIGNNNEHNERTQYTIYKCCLCNKALTDYEIKALYSQRNEYGRTNNMAKNYSQVVDDVSGANPIAWDISVGDAFDVLRITIKFDSAPTSAGNITIKIDASEGSNYDAILRTINPVGKTSVVEEDIKGFINGDAVRVDYANPDSRTIYSTANIEQ